MKVDRSKLKKSSFDVPHECKVLIDRIKSCNTADELYNEISQIKTWIYGKCELLNWADVLDKLDEVLERCCNSDDCWSLACNQPGNEKDRQLLLAVLQFSALLIEHSFTRHLYNSMEHLTTLLSSSEMTVVLAVIDVLYVFSKRSKYITRLANDKKQALIIRLIYLAESWGGKENGFGLAACCQNLPMSSYPCSATTGSLHFEYYEEPEESSSKKGLSHVLKQNVPFLDQSELSPAELMRSFTSTTAIPKDKEMQLFTHIRLAKSFSNYEKRLQFVQARLQALSTLVYSNSAQEYLNTLLYSGFVEELVEVLELQDPCLTDIKATTLRTLNAVMHLDRNSNNIIDATGAASYHGLLPVMMRNCTEHMTDIESEQLLQTTAVKQTSASSSVAICCDENVSSCRLPTQNNELLQVPFPEIVSRENQQKAPTHPNKSSGKICLCLCTRVESGSTNDAGAFLSSSAATNEVPMYCKIKIYAGVREMSFEELRAAAWFKRKQEQEQLQSQIQQEVQRQLQLALKSVSLKLEVMPVMQMTSQEAPSKAKQPQARLCVEADSSGEHEVHLEEQPADEEQIEKDAKTQVSLVTEKSIFDGPCSKITSKSEPIDGADVHMKTPNMKMTQNPLTLNEPQNVSHLSISSPTANTKQAMEIIKNLFSYDGSHWQSDIGLEVQSPTVHTKEAMSVIESMFSRSLRQTDLDFEKQFQLDPCATTAVDVFVDPDKKNKSKQTHFLATSGAVEICVDPSPPCTRNFTQYMDEDASKVENMSKSAGDAEPNLQTKNRKSLFMSVLDPIKECSEDSWSRVSSDSDCRNNSSVENS